MPEYLEIFLSQQEFQALARAGGSASATRQGLSQASRQSREQLLGISGRDRAHFLQP